LKEELQSPDIERIHTKFTNIFGEDVASRNDLEHIDQRAIGMKRKKPIGTISDWGNFAGDLFSFAGREYAVNKQQLKKLVEIYEEINNSIGVSYLTAGAGCLRQSTTRSTTASASTNAIRTGRWFCTRSITINRATDDSPQWRHVAGGGRRGWC